MKFSSVVSLHTNPYGCGVAKFGAELAKRLSIPFVGINGPWGHAPLFSLKWSEPNPMQQDLLVREIIQHGNCSVFWHDIGDPRITKAAKHVFYADPSLGAPGLWCPSLLTPSRPRTVRLFSFGMAGKLQLDHFEDVKALLQVGGFDYHLRVSSGLHEGTSLSDAMRGFDQLRDLMGHDNVTFLGILSDDALLDELHNADYVLAFFKDGVRYNNTTVHAAADAGCRIITNGRPLRKALTIETMDRWPTHTEYGWSWEALIEAMRQECEKSESRIA